MSKITYAQPSTDDLRRRFESLPIPSSSAVDECAASASSFANLLVRLCGWSPEMARALNHIEEGLLLALVARYRSGPPTASGA